MHSLSAFSAGTTDLVYKFDGDVEREKWTFNWESINKRSFRVRVRLFDTFGFSIKVKITFVVGYNIPLKRLGNNKTNLRSAATPAAKFLLSMFHGKLS